jgi:hypothetical protein
MCFKFKTSMHFNKYIEELHFYYFFHNFLDPECETDFKI